MKIAALFVCLGEILASQVHQGKICGEQTNFALGGQSQILKSPFYPTPFPGQIQCVWNIKALNPSMRVKIEFQDWIIPTSGKGCDQTYLQVTDGGSGVDPATGMAAATGFVKLCGRNPGFIVTHNNEVSLLLHGDSSGGAGPSALSLPPVQRFRLVISTTQDRPRMLDYKGHSVTNGRPKSLDAPAPARATAPPRMMMPRTNLAPRPRMPPYGHPAQIPSHPGAHPPRLHAEFQGAIHGGSSNAWPTQATVTTSQIDNDSKSSKKVATQVGNVGIILLVLAVLLFAVLGIVYFRKKRTKDEEKEEEKPEQK